MSELLKLIRETADSNEYTDPADLAAAVAAVAPSRQLRQLFAEAIADNCRHTLMSRRNDALSNAAAAASGSEPSSNGFSHRQRRVRDWWADFCAASAHVGSGNYKALGDCNVEDLQYLITERQVTIDRIQVHIDQYRSLINVMELRGVSVVRELTPGDASEAVAA